MKSTVNPPPHVYGTRALDRAADRRRDETWLGDRRADPATPLVLMDGLLVPVGGPQDPPPPLPPRGGGAGPPAGADAIFLGLRAGPAWFAEAAPGEAPLGARQVELRSV